MGAYVRMLLRVPRRLRKETVRRESVRLVQAFGTGLFEIQLPGRDGERASNGRHALELVRRYFDNGIRVEADPRGCLVQVHLAADYYAPGYERGNPWEIIAIARWLRGVWPDSVVLYSSDTGREFEELDEEAMWSHFVSERGRAYFDRDRGSFHGILCDFCDVPISMRTSLEDRTFGYECSGCGGAFVVSPDGRMKRPAASIMNDLRSPEVRFAELQVAIGAVACAEADVVRLQKTSPGPGITRWSFEIEGHVGDVSHAELFERAAVGLMKLADEAKEI